MHAQSLTSGAVAGQVRDEAGQQVPGASIALIDRATGVRRLRTTPRDGTFRFTFLLPGEYDLLVERFGYRPRLVRPVPVRAGGELGVLVVLALTTPEGNAVDTVRFGGVAGGGVQLATGAGGAVDDFARLADPLGLMNAGAAILPGGAGDLAAEGLPGRLGALALDGVTRWAPRHPRFPGATLDATAFPLASARGIELLAGGTDAEWPGSGGGVLSGVSVPGSGELQVGGSILAGSDIQSGLLVVSGPVVRDTAHFAVGAAVSRQTLGFAAPWINDTLGARLVSIAQDSFQTDLSAYTRPFESRTTTAALFGRFDWLVSRDHRLGLRANAGQATLDNPVLGDESPALGSQVTARDLSVAAALTSAVGARVGSELRVGVDAGRREHTAAPLVGLVFADAGLRAGAAATRPGEFSRTTIRFGETGHLSLGRAELKAGVQAAFTTIDQTYADGRAGTYVFGDSTGLAARTGAFRQTVGAPPVSRSKTTTAGVFAQAHLRPAPGLDLLVGVRYDTEKRDAAQIPFSAEWSRLTGIDNRDTPSTASQVSPRAAFTWALGPTRTWQVSGEAGRYFESSEPGLFAEAMTHAGGLSVRRGLGVLGAWPLVPDSTAAPVQGRALTLLGPQYLPPRTGRVQGALAGNVGGVIVRIGGAYRHTDYLPVRRDLNLAIDPSGRDQDGRVLYGALSASGALLMPTPGSNRRFSGFDQVVSLDPSGFSDYWGLSLSLDRAVSRGLSLLAHYTYSRTTDDWFGAGAWSADAQLVPFADSTGGTAWTKGRSDFDVPHRLALGAEARVPGRAGVRLAVLYRYRSGLPYTPGFRDGVDANGDGAAGNDPAFVSDTLPGAAALVAANACLRSQVGRLAQRNSCRAPAVTALDLRVAFTLGRVGRGRAEVVADVLGLVRGGTDLVDRALVLVDPATALVTDPVTHVTTVPYVANPLFGQALVRRDPGALWRVGLRVTY